MARRRLIGIGAGGLALIATVIIGTALVIGPDTSAASARLAAAASLRPVSDTQQLIWDTEARLSNGIDDANDNALVGAAYLQLARETADPSYYALAESAYDHALELEPDNVEALIGQGSLALSRHEFGEALEIGERALAVNATIPRIYGIVGDAQVELGRYDEALATVQTMVDMRPDLASYSRVSYLRELHGDLEGAIDAMTQAVEAGGPAAENTEYLRVQLGQLYFATGDLERAEAAFASSLERLPDYVYALAGMARVRAAEGKLDEAIDLYRQATDRIPLPEFVVALGETYEAAARQPEADEQYALAEAMQRLFEANGVRTDLELALFFADHGDPRRAVDLASAAHQRQPSIRAADALAWAEFKAGDIEAAARHADEALRIGTRDGRMLFHAGLIAEAAGQTDLARQRLGDALSLNPRFSPLYAPLAREARERLGTGD